MINTIYELYQGVTPIRRVYLDGHVIWTLPRYLPPYFTHNDIHLLSDVDGLISVDTKLLNRLFRENHISQNIQGGFNDLPAEVISRIVDESYSYDKTYGLSAKGELFNYILSKPYTIISELYTAVGAHGELVDDILDYNILINRLYNAVGSHGELVDNILKYDISIDRLDSAVGARGELFNHIVSEYGVSLNHLDSAVSARGRLLDHMSSEYDVSIDRLDTAVSAHGKLLDHILLDYGISINHLDSAVAARGKLFDYPSLEHGISIKHLDRALSANSKLIDHLLSEYDISIIDVNNVISAAAKNDFRNGNITIYYDMATSTGNVLGGKLISHDDSVKVAKELSITQGIVDGINRNTNVTVTVSGSGNGDLDADSNISLDIMTWLLPQQVGSNLYIPQIYDDGVAVGAVQNGEDLAIELTTFVN